MKLSYNQLNHYIKNNSEINYLSDSTEFQNENTHIDFTQFSNDSYILFEYTTEDFTKLINTLKYYNINYTELTDFLDLSFIIINN